MDEEEIGEYTLDEGLEMVGFGKFQALNLAYAGLGWFSEAMEIMILSFIGTAVNTEWGLSSSQESLLSTVVFAGMLVGAYSWGLISDNYGRRQAYPLFSFHPWFPRYTCGNKYSWTIECILPKLSSKRGMWMVIFTSFWTFGTIFEASLAWIVMPRLNWRWLLALSSAPSFALLLFYAVVPESPRYLCMKGRTSDALQILEKIASVNQRRLPPGILISGRTNGQDEDASLYVDTFITSLAELPGILLAAILVDRVGRKQCMAFMFLLAFIFLLPLLTHQSAVLATCLLFGARMFASGTFNVACIYTPEIYPTPVRTTGAGVASAMGRIGGMVCPLVAVGLVSECHQTAAVALFLVVILVSVVCILLFPYETNGRELSDALVVVST
ncbi:General substrate transporter [Corchorus olitorius]|uniref:General substrate transporter n=1 Tax=Corchorus olitorius TaxID=93759 RepID=A0A1R3KEH6_9ROSI|nr:General substrate transporter [Corchorus olitorius]